MQKLSMLAILMALSLGPALVGCPPPSPSVDPPVAAFGADTTSGDAPLTVNFTNASDLGTGALVSYAWDFGDTGTSEQANPTHQYANEGTYTVSLTVTTTVGSDTETRTGYITVSSTPAGPTAAFSADTTSGLAALDVTFIDESTGGSGTIVSWDWDFGDGVGSTLQHPSHTYVSPGAYNVSLTVNTASAADDITMTDYITVNGPAMVKVPAGTFTMGSTDVAPPTPARDPLELALQLNAQGWGSGDRNGAGSSPFGTRVGNGLEDAVEFGFLEAVLRSSATGEPYDTIRAAWDTNLQKLTDLTTNPAWAGAARWFIQNEDGVRTSGDHVFNLCSVHVMAGFVTIGNNLDYIQTWLGYFDTGSTSSPYDFAGNGYDFSAWPWLSADADADGDSVLNKNEWATMMDADSYTQFIWSTKQSVTAQYADLALDDTRTSGQAYTPDNGYPLREVTLSAYQIGRYEITNAQIAEVMNWAWGRGLIDVEDGRVRLAGADIRNLFETNDEDCQVSFSSSTFSVESRDGEDMGDHPVVEVTWLGAAAFCNWLSEIHGLTPCYNLPDFTLKSPLPNGYRLPTEAEWECAAGWDTTLNSGTGGQWFYAFSGGMAPGDIGFARSNYSDYYGMGLANPAGLTTRPYTAPVGYYDGLNAGTQLSVSPVGAFEMSGNVWEWCHDWYAAYEPGPQANPTGQVADLYHVMRGGAWSFLGTDGHVAHRAYEIPTHGGGYEGFRVVRNQPD